MNAVMMTNRTVFIADTPTSTPIPGGRDRRDHACFAADEIRRFGIVPKVALLSHSSFGTSDHPSAREDAAARSGS